MVEIVESHPACINCPENCCEAENSMIWITKEEQERAVKLSGNKIKTIKEGSRFRILTPCYFLENGFCKIYESRFKICREYITCKRMERKIVC